MQLLKRAPVGWAMVLGAVALLATSCEGVETTASASGNMSTTTTTVTKVTYDASSRPYLAIRYLTRDGSDRYTLKTGPGVVRYQPPEAAADATPTARPQLSHVHACGRLPSVRWVTASRHCCGHFVTSGP